MRAGTLLGLACTVGLLCGIGGILAAGSIASAPALRAIGTPPSDVPAEHISFPSASGKPLVGWFIGGRPGRGAVLLMHGIRANRLEMLGRARMLYAHGFSVLLFDFQAHGESPGTQMTFGYLEALDARGAFDYLRRRLPDERIGIVGTSLGGAATILSEKPIEADAFVLEAVFGSFDEALSQRLTSRFGSLLGHVVFPLLKVQVSPRLGFDPDRLNPAEKVSRLHAPLLLIAGGSDNLATLAEMKRIYARANEPKELWVIPNAAHVDFHRFAPAEYEQRVVAFFASRLPR